MFVLLTFTAVLSATGTALLLWPNYGLLTFVLAPIVASLLTLFMAILYAKGDHSPNRPAEDERLHDNLRRTIWPSTRSG